MSSLEISGAAHDINDSREIAGVTFVDSRSLGYVWRHGVATYLPTPSGGESVARAINNRGQIVGLIREASGEWHGAIFAPN